MGKKVKKFTSEDLKRIERTMPKEELRTMEQKDLLIRIKKSIKKN